MLTLVPLNGPLVWSGEDQRCAVIAVGRERCEPRLNDMLRELGLCAIEETIPSLNCGECHRRVTSGVLRVVYCEWCGVLRLSLRIRSLSRDEGEGAKSTGRMWISQHSCFRTNGTADRGGLDVCVSHD